MEGSLIYRILESTAWRMDAPPLFGAFHICAALAVIIAAVLGAWRVRAIDRPGRIRILSAAGLLLMLFEIYKQLFLYFIVNRGVYDWWYFPFQLCSVPMYLCILMPLYAGIKHSSESSLSGAYRSRRLYSASMTFLATFSLTGALAALMIPEDFLRSYVSLTVHGFIWHGLLVFISLTVILSGMSDLSLRSFAGASGLFLLFCAVAVLINILTEPVMSAASSQGLIPNTYAAMFYLNPYHLSPQPVVGTVQRAIGIPAGLALYVIAVILASGAVCLVLRLLTAKSGSK